MVDVKEKEIRTPNLNLLLCKIVLTEEGKLMLELKNGKRVEQLSVDAFLAEINDFAQECVTKFQTE